MMVMMMVMVVVVLLLQLVLRPLMYYAVSFRFNPPALHALIYLWVTRTQSHQYTHRHPNIHILTHTRAYIYEKKFQCGNDTECHTHCVRLSIHIYIDVYSVFHWHSYNSPLFIAASVSFSLDRSLRCCFLSFLFSFIRLLSVFRCLFLCCKSQNH